MPEFKIAGKSYIAPDRSTAERMHDEAMRRAKETPLALHTIKNVDIQASHAMKTTISKWTSIPMDKRAKLTTAITLAPAIVREALAQLNDHLKLERPGCDQDPDRIDLTPVGLSLLKYFNLEVAKADYWKYVRGIIVNLQKVQAGLGGKYTIELGNFGARGRVEGFDMGNLAASPVRQVFGFADEWGHVPYTGWTRYGHIELSYAYITDTLETFTVTQPDGIARTIVHEASHKWALTKDVLYKKDSFLKSDDELDQKELKKNSFQIPGRDKVFRPMMGREKGQQQAIPPERWLENADSYAWLARRLWKKAGRPAQ